MITYTPADFQRDIISLAKVVRENPRGIEHDTIYGVPRGGCIVAVALAKELGITCILNEDPLLTLEYAGDEGYLIVDDVIDSGTTRNRYRKFDFACLHRKDELDLTPITEEGVFTFMANPEIENVWIHYWWEGEEAPAEDGVIRIIQAIGDDPSREGILETPKRVVKSWGELYSGYKQEAKDMFTSFSSDGYDQLVLLKDIEFFSMCEHHMLPFFGKAHIAYIPNTKVVGISKLARLLDVYSRRLQIQERIGEQVTKDIMTNLGAKGAACIIEAQHLCMRMRGVGKQHSIMTTSSVKGTFLEDGNARAELMGLVK